MGHRLSPLRLVLAVVVVLLTVGGLQPVAGAASARSLTLVASPAAAVVKGTVRLTGTLTKSPKGAVVAIQRKSGKTWVAAASTRTTTGRGAYAVQVKLPATPGQYSFRAVVAKKGSLKAATSKVVKVSALRPVAVSLAATPLTPAWGAGTTLAGTVAPFVAGTTVAVQKQVGGGGWGTVTTTAVDAVGGFSTHVALLEDTVFRVAVPRQGLSSAAVSPPVTVSVVPEIATVSLPDALVGGPYASNLTTSGGESGTWSVTPALPAGLVLDTATGLISGTPTGPGTTASLQIGFIRAAGGLVAPSKQLSLQVVQPNPSILTTSLPDAQVLTAYSAQLYVSGAVAGAWSITGLAGSGLTLDPASGLISGTAPASPTTLNLTVDFTETSTGTAADPRQLSITVAAANPIHAQAGAGGQFSCRTDVDRTLWCWGYDDSGQVGDGGPVTSNPASVLSPLQIGSATDWSGLTTGGSGLISERHACAIRGATGYCWGSDKTGQLGSSAATGSATSPVQVSGGHAWSQLAAGHTSSCGVTTAGALYCWGSNSFGQLGISGAPDQDVPARVGAQSDWVAVSVGYNHACAVKADHSLYCWGYNVRGQLGTGDTGSALEPAPVDGGPVWSSVAVGAGYTCAVRTDGTTWCWGPSTNGQLGNGVTTNSTATDELSPRQVGTAADWTGVAIGDSASCATNASGELWCWGGNGTGQVGDGSQTTRSVPTRVGTASDWQSVAIGDAHTCAVNDAGAVYCWGANPHGQLGNGSTTLSLVPVAIS